MRTFRPAASALRTLALAAALSLSPTVARAQDPVALAPGMWAEFSWFDGVGSFTDPTGGFLLDVLRPVRVRVTDAFSAGDAFDLFVNGAWRLSTDEVASNDAVQAGTGDAAWADPRLSRGALTLGPGRYTLTLQVRAAAEGWDYGSGFLRADLIDEPTTTVPEPATTALLGSGLLALAAGAVRRRRAAQAGSR